LFLFRSRAARPNNAALAFFNEPHEAINLRITVSKRNDLGLIRAMTPAMHKKTEDPLEPLNNLALDSPALKANLVNADGPCVVARGKREGGKVAVKGCAHACVGMGSHPAKLVYQGEATQGDTIFNVNMACKRGVVCKNNVASDFAVMGNVAIRHNQVMVSYTCHPSTPNGSTVKGGRFSNDVVIANNKLCGFIFVAQVLGRLAKTYKRVDLTVFANGAGARNNRMRGNPATLANFYVGTNDGKGVNPYVIGQ
jgi:hypothetical protein